MNTIKKLLIASTMVFTLSTITSCNNKKNTDEFSAGLPYTLVTTYEWLGEGEELTLGFDYTGKNMKVYWGDDIEKSSTEKVHTFQGNADGVAPYFIVEGDITSIWLTDKDGNSIQTGNEKIRTVIFSNTITNLPKRACSSLMDLRTVFIPRSVKKIGEYAFTPSVYYRHDDTEGIYCEVEDRPSTWSPNWYYGPIMGNLVNWGFSYYIFDDGQTYIVYNRNGNSAAAYMGYAFPTDIKKVVIPQTIEINKYKFDVTFILGAGYEDNSVEELEINNNVKYIYSDAFEYFDNLETVNFIGDFDFLYFEDYVFGYCEQLESITLPKGLINLSYSMFEGCDALNHVVIPGTVQYIDDDIFYSACEGIELEIDITGYKTAESIPNCNDDEMFDYCQASEVTFVYDGNAIDKQEFINKGWPELQTGYNDEIPVSWEAKP